MKNSKCRRQKKLPANLHFFKLDSDDDPGNEHAGSQLNENDDHWCNSAAREPNGKVVLLCTEPARDSFAATIPYRRAEAQQATTRRAKINSFARVSRSVWEIRFRLQFPLPFLPGQFIEASFPGIEGPRRFSMANAPTKQFAGPRMQYSILSNSPLMVTDCEITRTAFISFGKNGHSEVRDGARLDRPDRAAIGTTIKD